MILSFEKSDKDETIVRVDGKEFSSKDYITMVKEIKERRDIEVTFDEGIPEEDRESVIQMIQKINSVGRVEPEPVQEESLEDDLPF